MRRMVTTCCLLAIAAAAWAGEVAPQEGPTLHGLPLYPSVLSAPFEGDMQANGIPLQTTVLTTADGIEQVVAFFKKYVEDHGLTLSHHMHAPGSGYVGYYDPKSGEMRLATVFSSPEGGTVIVYSAMDPRPMVAQSLAVPADLPALPGARDIATVDHDEGQSRERSVRYTLPGLSPEAARQKLVEVARRQGWSLNEADPLFQGRSVVLVRKDQRCILRVDPLESEPPGKEVATSVTLMVFERVKPGSQGERP